MATNYIDEFKKDPVAFMGRYSCMPGDNLSNQEGVRVGGLNEGWKKQSARAKNSKVQASYDYNRMGNAHEIGYLEFKKVKHTNATTGEKGMLMIGGSYVAANDKLAAYFLPWSWNTIISLTIPQFTGRLNDHQPRFFFTAAINGCSVFIKGSAENPTVYHAGGDTYRPDPSDGAKFWRKMLESRKDTGKNMGKLIGEVNKTMYVKDGVDGTTADSRQWDQWLRHTVGTNAAAIVAPGANITIQQVRPQGCVFGWRTEGRWKFYLQENAVIIYDSLTVTGTKRHTAMRPMIVRQIFPGNGNATLVPAITRVLKA